MAAGSGDDEIKLDLESLPSYQFEPLASGVEGAISAAKRDQENGYSDEEDGHGASDRKKLMSEESSSSSWFSFLSLEYYQGFCDVTTSDVFQRVMAGLSPWPFNLAMAVTSNPDLYGPFWLCMTLVLTTAISGNIAKFFSGSSAWQFNMHHVVVIATIVYSYTWAVPGILWLLLVWRRTTDRYSLLQLLAIYGYSMSVFIPLTLLWLINIDILRWVLLAVAVVSSGSVLVRALWKPLKNESPKLAVIILIILFLIHSAVAIGFKFYYFSSGLAQPVAGHSTAAQPTHAPSLHPNTITLLNSTHPTINN